MKGTMIKQAMVENQLDTFVRSCSSLIFVDLSHRTISPCATRKEHFANFHVARSFEAVSLTIGQYTVSFGDVDDKCIGALPKAAMDTLTERRRTATPV